MSRPSLLLSSEVTMSWELFVLLKRLPQCHWSVLCLCRCWWGAPAALVTAGATSAFAVLRYILYFQAILLIFTPVFQHSVSHFTISSKSSTALCTVLTALLIIQSRLSRTWHSCHVWVTFKTCSKSLPFNLTYASKLPTQVTFLYGSKTFCSVTEVYVKQHKIDGSITWRTAKQRLMKCKCREKVFKSDLSFWNTAVTVINTINQAGAVALAQTHA